MIDLPAAAGGDGGSYANLANAAFAFLGESGGRATADDLAAAMFGATARGPLWTKLVRRILGADPRFVEIDDGRWLLAGLDAATLPLAEVDFVVLDLEATGLKPWRQRLVEVAALRLRADGEVGDAFASLVNPERRLPKYLADQAGLTQEDLAEAPPFAEIAPGLLSFLEGAVLVGHGLELNLAYLQNEVRLLERPPLANPVLDTLELAGRLLPGRGKPTLDNLARLLGLPVGRRHRAPTDARLVAAVFAHLLRLARAQGAAELADLLPRTSGGARYALLDASPLRDVPATPGVYLLKDAAGEVVYVGKAVNLRARLSTYFASPPAYVRRMEGLLEAVADFATVPLGSELEALLEEWCLIGAHQPRFNVQYRAKAQPAFLRLDLGEPYPRLSAVAEPAADGARYWGPLRNGVAVREALKTLADLFPLREYRRKIRPLKRKKPRRVREGQQLSLDANAGFMVEEERYRALAEEVARFLDGERAGTVGRLQAQMAAAVAEGDRPRVAILAKHLRLARLFTLEGRQAWQPRAESRVAVVRPSVEARMAEVFVLYCGRYGGRRRLDPWDEDEEALASDMRRMAAEARAGDEANIVERWLVAHPDAPAVPLPAGDAEQGWQEAAATLLLLAQDLPSAATDIPEYEEDEV